MTRRTSLIAASLLLVVFMVQAVLSMRMKTVTFDETAHIPAGYSYLATGDFRLNPEQPPFIKLLAACPLLFLKLQAPFNNQYWQESAEYPFGSQFLFGSGNDADLVIFLSRLPMVLLGALLGCYIFVWSRELYGSTAGLLSLFFFAFCPNMLAHTRLVTMDVGVGCFMLIACYHAWRYLEAPSVTGLVLTALFTGLAVVTKFSGLLLGPIVVVLFASRLRQKDRLFRASGRLSRLAERPLLFLCASLFSIALISLAMIYVVYGLKPDSLQLYKHGMDIIYKNHVAGYKYYLNGQFSVKPWWYYYLFAFIVKTPIPTLILIMLATLLFTKKRLSDELWLILPAALIIVVSFFDAANTSIRRILPAYPFLFVLIGKTAVWVERDSATAKRNVRKALLAVLCIWLLVASIRIYPDYLTYFNEGVGGPRQGMYHLDDSNIDWGEDLNRLKTFMDERGIGAVKLLYFGTADPAYYGIKTLPLSESEIAHLPEQGMYYAISTHMLVRTNLARIERGYEIDWMRQLTPMEVIGNSLYIYKF